MSDFLTRLVSRSITPVPSVQPRLASRFEAIAPGPDAALNIPVDVDPSDIQSVPRAAHRPPPLIGHSPQTSSMAAESPAASVEEQPSRPDERLPAVHPLDQPHPAPVVPTEASSPQRSIPPGPPRPPELQQLTPPLPLERPKISSHPSEMVVSDHRNEPSVQEVRSQAEPPLMIAVERLSADTPHPTETPTATPAPDLPQPLQAPRQAEPLGWVPRPVVAAPAVSTPPTIQVTIGRIEVRATTQASAARPASAPAKPALSLDQYLRQRAGGQP